MSSRVEASRNRLLDAAERLIIERGFHGIGLERVAAAAGLSRQAVYLHFPSKSALLLAMVDRFDRTHGLPQLLERYQRVRSAEEALDVAVQLEAAYEPVVYPLGRMLHAARTLEPAAEAAWQDRMSGRREVARRLAKWLRRDGVLSDEWTVEEAADFIWTLLGLHVYEALVVESKWSRSRYARQLRTVLRRTLLKNAGSKHRA